MVSKRQGNPRAPLVKVLSQSIEGSDLQDGLTIPNSMHPKIWSYRLVERFAASSIVTCDGTSNAAVTLIHSIPKNYRHGQIHQHQVNP